MVVSNRGPLTAPIAGICSLIGVRILGAGLAVNGLHSVNRHDDEFAEAAPDKEYVRFPCQDAVVSCRTNRAIAN